MLHVPPATESTAQAPVSTVLVDDALVLSVTSDPSGAWLVTVVVDEDDAPAVTAAAAAGRVSVGLLPVSAARGVGAEGDAPAGEASTSDGEGEG